MGGRYLVMLLMALATLAPAAAGERESSYSLEQLRVIARSVHPTLEAAEAAREVSSGLLNQAAAYSNPRLVLGVGRGRPRDGGDARSENQFLLVQPIEILGLRRWRKRLGEVNFRGAEADRVLAESIIDSATAVLVYEVLLAERRAEISKQSVELTERLQQLLEHRADLGESSPLEVMKARTEWFTRRRDLLDAQGATSAARAALRLFCGERIPKDFILADRLQKVNLVELPLDLVERLLLRNPALIRAAITVEEAGVRTEVAKKKILPAINVIAGYETELDREGGSIGVGLTVPLWSALEHDLMTRNAIVRKQTD